MELGERRSAEDIVTELQHTVEVTTPNTPEGDAIGNYLSLSRANNELSRRRHDWQNAAQIDKPLRESEMRVSEVKEGTIAAMVDLRVDSDMPYRKVFKKVQDLERQYRMMTDPVMDPFYRKVDKLWVEKLK